MCRQLTPGALTARGFIFQRLRLKNCLKLRRDEQLLNYGLDLNLLPYIWAQIVEEMIREMERDSAREEAGEGGC